MMRPNWRDTSGFLVLDIMIAGLILTSGIAATMYLFQTGYGYLDRARAANTLSVKMIQVPALLRTLDLAKQQGTANLGNGVFCRWQAGLLDTADLTDPEKKENSGDSYQLLLYRVNLTLFLEKSRRDCAMNVFRYKNKNGL